QANHGESSLKQLVWAVSRRPGVLASTVARAAAVLILVATSPGGPAVHAQAGAMLPDLRSIVLTANDLPGYNLDPTRTAVQDRPDGSVSYDAVYVRSGGGGPSEVRLAAARTASGRASSQAMSETRDTLLGGGWNQRDVPLLGDEAVGF